MGAGNSTPTNEVSQHIFSAAGPVRLSGELVDSLQKNTQTDLTRTKQQELQYQLRLTSELEKLRDQEAQNLSKLSENLSTESEQSSAPSLAGVISDAASSSSTLAEKQRQNEMSRESVSKEIEALKKKLDSRKKLEQVDANVGKAKEELVACLRTHDRRPLDCWKEVETFRREVGRLEKEFVEKTVS